MSFRRLHRKLIKHRTCKHGQTRISLFWCRRNTNFLPCLFLLVDYPSDHIASHCNQSFQIFFKKLSELGMHWRGIQTIKNGSSTHVVHMNNVITVPMHSISFWCVSMKRTLLGYRNMSMLLGFEHCIHRHVLTNVIRFQISILASFRREIRFGERRPCISGVDPR